MIKSNLVFEAETPNLIIENPSHSIYKIQNRHFCKFILSRFINRRLDLSITLALACFANTTDWSPLSLLFTEAGPDQ